MAKLSPVQERTMRRLRQGNGLPPFRIDITYPARLSCRCSAWTPAPMLQGAQVGCPRHGLQTVVLAPKRTKGWA